MLHYLFVACIIILYGLLAIDAYGQQYRYRYIVWVAVLAHAYFLHQCIDGPLGQNLSVVNLFSLIAWLACFILAFSPFSIASLGVLIYPIAAVSLGLIAILSSCFIVSTSHQPWALFHILWATLVVGLFVLSGCQALLLAVQEQLLKRKKLTGLLQRLPPLQLMESALFTLVKLGVYALSILLVASLFLFKVNHLPGLWSKILLGGCVWGVFSGLLLGRHFLGWRGNTAVVWTLIGVVLAVGVYLGSHFLLLI